MFLSLFLLPYTLAYLPKNYDLEAIYSLEQCSFEIKQEVLPSSLGPLSSKRHPPHRHPRKPLM